MEGEEGGDVSPENKTEETEAVEYALKNSSTQEEKKRTARSEEREKRAGGQDAIDPSFSCRQQPHFYAAREEAHKCEEEAAAEAATQARPHKHTHTKEPRGSARAGEFSINRRQMRKHQPPLPRLRSEKRMR